jgi:folate-binding protein YgfZ
MSSAELRSVTPNDDDLRDYDCLTRAWGFVDFGRRTQIELRGEDRQQFLHNLCTNDILRLRPEQGCEAFVTNVQGKCLGHVLVFAGHQSLVIETSPDQAAGLLSHFDRYLITDDVQLVDHTDDWGELLVAGRSAKGWIERLTGGDSIEAMCDHRAVQCGGVPAWVRRAPMTIEPSYLIACKRTDLPAVHKQLHADGAVPCGAAAFHMARIEKGFPWYGWDITEKNLPQEVNRDQAAISFEKGCYLGQETVARIDALGHVNRIAVALRCEPAEVPQVGTPLMVDQQTVGEMTSAATSPRLSAPVALAYVRRRFAEPGTTLALPHGTATVVRLPVSRAV